uniref:Putative rna-binding protein n=1 Tax=Ornithodoros turicata TaxID=34597 RepID=A0A2R5LLW1_9ACAR
MSRIIVKNLPKRVNEERLRQHFSTKGVITDLQLKYTKEGVFRRFAFIGFQKEEAAQSAKQFFHGTYLDTSKLEVDVCRPLGDAEKPRSWSKYSHDSSAYQKLHPEEVKPQKKEPAKPKNANFAKSFLQDLEDNEEFEEFLEVHKKKGNKAIWSNDAIAADAQAAKLNKEQCNEEKSSEGKDEGYDTFPEDKDGKPKGKGAVSGVEIQDEKEEDVPASKPSLPQEEYKFNIKVKGLPYNSKKKQIKDFFKPAKVASLRVPPKVKGIAYLGFKTEKDMKQALNKHKSFMGGRRLDVKVYNKKVVQQKQWKQFPDLEDPTETLADTGRIYVRNLSYTVTEDDIDDLFKRYGPLSEVHLSMDKFTRKPKGFAFVTFLFPEHAIKAFSELDGKLLQGRLLHLLPSKSKPSEEGDESGGPVNYKEKKAAQQKKTSGSSHNWNTLFLGANAVADVMAERYDTTKEELLGTERGDSVAVRMALGETQIVNETRSFLEKQGVQLDAFSRPAVQRSKTVILVKNLPARTKQEELRLTFAKFGVLSRVVLPPCGITALVEFQEPTEARTAFRRLAYSKFKDSPLYLEWAPTNVFSKPALHVDKSEEDDTEKDVAVKESEEGENQDGESGNEAELPPAEPDSTLFVKNLNFATTEDSLRRHFKSCGTILEVTIATKKDPKNVGQHLSMGYGFVQFQKKKYAKKALKELQRSQLDGHALELKISKRETHESYVQQRKAVNIGKGGTKILVRNVPFQASKKEITELFNVFGTLRDVRLPKKMAGTGKHRGFAFVDFLAKNDAKRAFQALCQSTHLYGRRLVLEWASTDDDDVDELRRKTAEHFISGPSKKRLKKSELQATLDAPPAEHDGDSS